MSLTYIDVQLPFNLLKCIADIGLYQAGSRCFVIWHQAPLVNLQVKSRPHNFQTAITLNYRDTSQLHSCDDTADNL